MKRSNGLCFIVCALFALPSFSKTPVFEKDNFTFSVGGDFEIQYRERAEPGDDAEIEYDDVELHFFGDYDVSDTTSVFNRIDLDFKGEIDNDDSADVLDKAILGINWQNFKLGVGKDDYATDDYSPDFDYEMGGNDAFPQDAGDDLIFGTATFGDFQLRFSTDIGEGDDGEAEDEKSVDLIARYNFGGWEVGLAYQDFTPGETIDEDTGAITSADDIDTTGVYVAGKIGNFKTILGYSDNDEGSWIQAAGKYKISDVWSIAGGYETFSADADTESDIDVYYANLTYALTKHVKLFTEVGQEDENDGDDEFGWLVGIQVRF